MPTLYRVFPFLASAALQDPGGPLYVPPQGGGRLDNPGLYSTLYLSNSPAGAIAEAFGRFPEWTSAILAGSPNLPGSVRVVARYQLAGDIRVCDLDDPQQLEAHNLRPSEVISRDYDRTRAWARRIFEQKTWSGVRWWSYYDPRWASYGLWDIRRLTVENVEALHLDHPALVEASRVILRQIVRKGRKRHPAGF